MKWLDHLRIQYTLRRYPIPHDIWNALIHEAKIFHGLTAVEKAHLRELTTLFIHRKSFVGVKHLTVSPEMAVAVAAQACLPILKLGLNYFQGWIEIVIYPSGFRVERDTTDLGGVVSHEDQALSGESWLRGPVILSWDDIEEDLGTTHSGRNVVVHEFAHKLDMLNGAANGMPPLHSGMVVKEWTKAFSEAYEHLQYRLAHHHHPGINAYAATSPAEYFAVTSEYFFADPHTLHHHYPAVYDQLALFYRQNTMSRQQPVAHERHQHQ